MKKVLLLFTALFVCRFVSAQCPLNYAVDFTATDIHGEEIRLFDILDRGQYVLIDFFFIACGPCQGAVPHVVDAYYELGCNEHDVFFMEISPNDNNNLLNNYWVNEYGVEYPTIGTDGGGAEICDMYGIPAYPTVILISPSRAILLKDIWPISSAQDVVNALTNYNIDEYDCEEAPLPCDAPANLSVSLNGSDASLTWEASPAALYYNIYRNAEKISTSTLLEYVDQDLEYMTNYCYTVSAVCDVQEESDMSNEACVMPETILIEPDTANFYVNTIGDDNVEEPVYVQIQNLRSEELVISGYSLTNAENNPYSFVCYADDIDIETEDLVVPSGESAEIMIQMNVENIDESFLEDVLIFHTDASDYTLNMAFHYFENINEILDDNISIYPNPAKETVSISTSLSSDMNVEIFDISMRKLKDIKIEGSTTEMIDISELNSGVYFMYISQNGGRIVKKLIVD